MMKTSSIFRAASAVITMVSLLAAGPSAAESASFQPTFRVSLPADHAARFVVYGDMRFTSPTEVEASRPKVRQALVAEIAREAPDAVFLTGDVPWHGGTTADYDVYRSETAAWDRQGIAVYPALGNHEFAKCEEQECLRHWWATFPALNGLRWYSVDFSDKFVAVALDTDASLQPDSPQRRWLDEQLSQLPATVQGLMFFMHHPPSADPQSGELASHNVRANEAAFATYLEAFLERRQTPTATLVVAGHIHNYERRQSGRVVYLVSGGGGARPYPVVRDEGDAYRSGLEPNFHYVRLSLVPSGFHAEMIRLEDPDATAPGVFRSRDAFDVLSH
jgi:acid phosphatase type 7